MKEIANIASFIGSITRLLGNSKGEIFLFTKVGIFYKHHHYFSGKSIEQTFLVVRLVLISTIILLTNP